MAEQEAAGSKQETQELAGLSVPMRIPPIWRDRLRLWFAQFEAIVSSHKKGDKAMYELVVGQLERQDVDEIDDIILNPPKENKYETLKRRLLEVYEESEQRQLQRLLSEMELGEMKPSQLLRRMRNLAGAGVAESTLRIMWMNHLPQSARAVLAVSDTISKTTELSELALMADKILEHTTNQISAITSSGQDSTTSTPKHEDTSLSQKIDLLTKEIAELKMKQEEYRFNRQPRRNWRYNNRSRSHSRSQSETRPPHTSAYRSQRRTVCYFHWKFGKQARRCTNPCNFQDENKTSEN